LWWNFDFTGKKKRENVVEIYIWEILWECFQVLFLHFLLSFFFEETASLIYGYLFSAVHISNSFVAKWAKKHKHVFSLFRADFFTLFCRKAVKMGFSPFQKNSFAFEMMHYIWKPQTHSTPPARFKIVYDEGFLFFLNMKNSEIFLSNCDLCILVGERRIFFYQN
jgi:hypothetical protein